MANKRISELTLHTTLSNNDFFPLVKEGETVRVAYATLKTKIQEGLLSGSHTDITSLNTYTSSVDDRLTSIEAVTGSYITSETDSQTLSIAGDQLSISNGNTLTLPSTSTTISPLVFTSDNTIVAIPTSTPVIVTGMTATPSAGSYLVNFNSQYTIDDVSSQTAQTKTDVIALYDELMALTTTVTRAGGVYGNGETLTAGVYDFAAATSLNGILTLNAQGDSTKQFVFRCTGAFTTNTFSEVALTGGALSSNVWFVSEGAGSTGADTIFRGSILANQAAVSTGARTTMEGRLLNITGQNSIDTTTFTIPTGTSGFDLGILDTFTMFTGTGALGNAGASVIPQSIGTNAGAITGFATATVSGSIISAGSPSQSTFSCGVYIDGVLISNSRRTTDKPFEALDFEYPVILQTVATITEGQTIDIRAYAELGEQHIGPRMALSLIPIVL